VRFLASPIAASLRFFSPPRMEYDSLQSEFQFQEALLVDRLSSYLNSGEDVPGWLDQYSAAFIADLSRLQAKSGITGAVGEIGVHMGRLFILLKLTAMLTERSFAIDVFGDQHKNIDHSGCGDRETFLQNVSRWTGNSDVNIIQSSSLDVRPDQIVHTVGRCRLVSIDGGHTEECTLSDLRLIEAVLTGPGVVILDDFFNPLWAGVATGASKYFLNPVTTLRPFAITPNKLYLSVATSHEFYRSALQTTQAGHFNKTVCMFGNDVDVFGHGVKYHTWRELTRIAIHQSPLTPFARRAKKMVTRAISISRFSGPC
jgi:hypothetical protein